MAKKKKFEEQSAESLHTFSPLLLNCARFQWKWELCYPCNLYSFILIITVQKACQVVLLIFHFLFLFLRFEWSLS